MGHPARVQIRVGLCNSTWQKFVIAVTKFLPARVCLQERREAARTGAAHTHGGDAQPSETKVVGRRRVQGLGSTANRRAVLGSAGASQTTGSTTRAGPLGVLRSKGHTIRIPPGTHEGGCDRSTAVCRGVAVRAWITKSASHERKTLGAGRLCVGEPYRPSVRTQCSHEGGLVHPTVVLRSVSAIEPE